MLEITVRDGKQGPAMEVFLRKDGDWVSVMARDNRGFEWNLAWLTHAGIIMGEGIPMSTEWPLDGDGRLIVTNPKAG